MTALGGLAPATLATLVLIGWNLLLRRTPYVKNWWIPWFSVAVGMILFPMWLPLVTSYQNPLGRNVGFGFLIGLMASIGYGGIVRIAEKRWPWLHDVLNSTTENESDTK